MSYVEKFLMCSLFILLSLYVQAQEGMDCGCKGLSDYWQSIGCFTKLCIEIFLVLIVLYGFISMFSCKKCLGACSIDSKKGSKI